MNRIDLIRQYSIDERMAGYPNAGPLAPLHPPKRRFRDSPTFVFWIGMALLVIAGVGCSVWADVIAWRFR